MNTTLLPSPRTFPLWALFLLLALVLVSRVPLLPLGFGSDADAWRAARAGHVLWTTGQYEVSRFPGYPLHEIVLAPVVGLGGAPLSNALTLLVTCIMLLVWAHLAARHGRFPLLLTVALSFAPTVWINSASTMDYVWSLACILVAMHLSLTDRFVVAGLFLGLAAGFRPPNSIAIVPIAFLIVLTNRSWKQVIAVVIISTATALLAFIPVFTTYGVRGWLAAMKVQLANVAIPFNDLLLLSAYRSVYALGLVPAIVIALLLAGNRKALSTALARRDVFVISSLAGLAVFILLFFTFPYDRAYLMPAIPFLLLLADRIATKKWMIALTVAVISYAFINIDVVRHHGARGTPGLDIRPGTVLQDWVDRTSLLSEREFLAQRTFPPKTIVMTGLEDSFTFLNTSLEPDTTLPRLALRERMFRSRTHPDLLFVSLLHEDELTPLLDEGYALFCRSEARAYIESVFRYDMSRYQVTILPPWEHP